MELEKQVCSLELAEKLKDLGVPQDSIFYWVRSDLGNMGVQYVKAFVHQRRPPDTDTFEYLSAFTVAELGEMFPTTIYDQSGEYFLNLGATSENIKYGNTREFTVSYVGIEKDIIHIHEHTEADARAKILIYLIENKLIPI